MIETKQFSVWAMPASVEQKKSTNDDNDEDERRRHRFKRCKAAYQKCCCCCPCSAPTLVGFLIGTLIGGIALATVLSIHLVDASKTTYASVNVISTTTITLTTGTTATTTSSTVSTSSTSTSSTSTSASSSSSSSSTSSTSTSSTSSTSTSTTSTQTTLTSTSSSTTSGTSTTVSTTTSVTTTSTTSTTTTAPYCTTRVTFDDIPGQSSTSGVVPNGYNNLNWTNILYLNASTTPISGYQTVVSSPSFVGYNPGGYTIRITTANGTRFAFNSIVVAPAWRDNLTWNIYGFRAGVNLLAGSFSLYVVNQTTLSCGGCSNWDTIYMTSSGGTPQPGLAENGTEFAFDDLCISFGY